MALHPGTPVLALGDFSNVIDLQLDRLSIRPGTKRVMPRTSPFAALITEMGLRDIWRERNRDVQCYSCHSASHGGLSRIDMGMGNDMLLPHVLDTAYEPASFRITLHFGSGWTQQLDLSDQCGELIRFG